MYLSLCLIAKDENSYIKEWLDYHILLGVEHFWIYDNESKIPLEDTLLSYIKKGWVTVNNIQGPAMQLFAYDHCLQTYGNLSQWIGFIDTDEFIVPKSSTDLRKLLTEYEPYGGLALNSLFFGSSGHQNRPQCGQISGYFLRTPDGFFRNRLIKTIVQPAKVLFPISPHTFLFSEGNYCVNELKYRVDDQFFPVHISKVQLNHYYTRSIQEMDEKKMRGRGDGGKAYDNNEWEAVLNNCSVIDYSAVNLVIQFSNLPPAIARNAAALTDPISTKILDELSKTAQRYQPPRCSASSFASIEKRKEMDDQLRLHLESMDFIAHGKMQDARKIFLQLIQQFPFALEYYTNFAAACINMGDLPKAWEALSQAWLISPRGLLVLKCMMEYFYTVGNYEQVEKCAGLLQEYGVLEPLSVAGLAVAQWKQGKQDLARENAQLIWNALTQNLSKHMYGIERWLIS